MNRYEGEEGGEEKDVEEGADSKIVNWELNLCTSTDHKIDKVMYQIEVPPMLSLSERKIEHERVMSSVAKDFSNPFGQENQMKDQKRKRRRIG